MPGLGRSPEEENGKPLCYAWLENPMDRGVWLVAVQGVAKSQTWLKHTQHIHGILGWWPPNKYVEVIQGSCPGAVSGFGSTYTYGQGRLACCDSWGRKESDTTEWLIWSDLICINESRLVAQLVKNLPAMQETWVQFLGQEDPLEKEMATHSGILAWRIPWIEEPGRLQSMRSQELDTT